MHRNQLNVDVETVRALVDSQFPEWATLSVEEFASPGTVNALFRIGDRLAARFPLQPGEVDETRQYSEQLLDVPRVRRIWAALRDLPRTASDVMTHGDLIPGNLFVTKGRLVGIIDVGGLGPADPALDLVGAWHLLQDGPRQALREDLASDDLEWARGMAWAFEQAMGVIWYYADSNPTMSRMGQRTLARLLGSDDL
jgi:aminoglycoside phosphotransferase (APT) family kinase protein